jgi:hypothetical protein
MSDIAQTTYAADVAELSTVRAAITSLLARLEDVTDPTPIDTTMGGGASTDNKGSQRLKLLYEREKMLMERIGISGGEHYQEFYQTNIGYNIVGTDGSETILDAS